jgi:hypothetical protein
MKYKKMKLIPVEFVGGIRVQIPVHFDPQHSLEKQARWKFGGCIPPTLPPQKLILENQEEK